MSGTLRDSLYILDAIHRLDAAEQPEVVVNDTGSYSDLVHGMLAMCGYQLAPRHADISDTQLWWIDTAMLEGGLTTGTRATNGWGDFNGSVAWTRP
ncbi:Tn3 family transposase [Nonomuraea sp. NPDC004580]|uniref:Tn3 family transposase n=1 Tax=Nonomuraea sp. NPDC004580 TaxID=3154552 RepID=UPI0033BE5595